jgi:hypothetical protein
MKIVLRGVAALAVLALAGVLIASNMGFKYNYTLLSGAELLSQTGTNTIALPYFRADTINTAADLQNSIGFADVANIQRFDEATDSLALFTGRKGSGPDFNLIASEANFVKMNTTVQYVIVGSHDPSFAVDLDGAAEVDSATGTNFYSYPYHATAEDAQQLMDDIGFANVANVQRFDEETDSLALYTGRKGSPPVFNLVPGEGYFIKMNATVSYVPSHY